MELEILTFDGQGEVLVIPAEPVGRLARDLTLVLV